MADTEKIVKKLEGTKEAEIISQMEEAYTNIAEQQARWFENSKITCAQGCGECCRNFEPDLLESEALYMAAWLLENQRETALAAAEGNFPYPQNKGCPFWNENAQYHCTMYGARPSICRLFGACGFSGKSGEVLLKPCKFYPEQELAKLNPPLQNKQYSQKEILQMYSALPPLMSNLMEPVAALNPDSKETELLRKSLPEAIRRLLWIESLIQN